MSHCTRLVSLAIAALAFHYPLRAQTITGTITGAVKDSTDAVIVGAKVTLVHEATRVQRQTITSEAGDFTFSSVQPGSYTLSVDHPGFKQFSSSGVNLTANERLPVDVRLQVGASSETVPGAIAGSAGPDGQ